MTIERASDNPFPSILIEEGTEPTAPAAGHQRLYIDSTTHLLKATNSSGTDRTIEGISAGAITSSGLTQATARLLGRTTASTGAVEEITVGAGLSLSAGSLTATGGGGLSSGTSFPGSPSTNDLYFRTDRGIIYFYNGTRWLSVDLMKTDMSTQTALAPYTASGASTQFGVAFGGEYDLWLEEFITNSAVVTTNTGSNYWTIPLTRDPSATALASYTTASDTVNVNTKHRVTIGALNGTSDGYFTCNPTKTGSPGSLYMQAMVTYRLVG